MSSTSRSSSSSGGIKSPPAGGGALSSTGGGSAVPPGDVASSSAGGGSSVPVPVERDMAPFVDGQYVRLLNRGRGGYLFADQTGRGVSIDSRRWMVNTVWAVQILETPRAVHLLFRGAYGRHLASTRVQPYPGHRGFHAAQCNFDELADRHVFWWTSRGKGGSVVLLHGTAGNLLGLRANGRFRRWRTRVTVETIRRRVSSMMEWEVEVVPVRVERPPYQLRPPSARTRYGPDANEIVEIDWDIADENGNFDYVNGPGGIIDPFFGRSLIDLCNALAPRVGGGANFHNMTLFIRAGALGQPFPLLTDLPDRDDAIGIVIYRNGTPGHSRLRYPDLSA